jgi:beta-glucosidase/6-phospho-beta-glucosidase/beta-galactosidase
MIVKPYHHKPFDVDLTGFQLPQGFVFGVCNSPYHSEGNFNTPTGPHNNWSQWENNGLIEKSGETNRFWDNYQNHIQKAAEIGLDVFRMGFAWERVQPSSSMVAAPEPDWDEAAFQRYAETMGAVYESGMEPCITLHHFTHPGWIGPHLWPDDHLVEKFLGFVERTVTEVNTRLVEQGYPAIRFFVTFNEPFNCLVGSYLGAGSPPIKPREDEIGFAKATVNMLYAHVRAYDIIYDLYEKSGWHQPHIAFNVVSYSIYELEKWYLDIVRAPSLGIPRNEVDAYLQEKKQIFNTAITPVARRRLNDFQFCYWDRLRDENAHRYARFNTTKLLDALYTSTRPTKLDYIGIDTYDPFALASVTFDDVYDKPEPTEGQIDPRFDWTLLSFDPDVMREHLAIHGQDLLSDGSDIPLYILETTIGNNQKLNAEPKPRPDGVTRELFLKASLRVVIELIQQGFPLKGFLYWTLCDNYEWGTYTSRLGLVEYDYQKHTILDTDAFGLPMLQIYKDLITAMRISDPEQIKAAFEPLR